MNKNIQLAKNVLEEIHKYDMMAKRNHRACLNISYLKRKMRINSQVWEEIKAGSPEINYETFQEAIGIIKQMKYNLGQQLKIRHSQQKSTSNLEQPFKSISKTNKHSDHVKIKGNQAFRRFASSQKTNVSNKKVITRITTQKHNSKRFNIFINRKYAFSVTANEIAKYYLYKGRTLTTKTIKKIKSSSSISKLINKAIPYVSKGMHSKIRVKRKLLKYSHDKELITDVIKKLEQMNLVNDAKFARLYVRDRRDLSYKGPLKIRQELLRKHIKSEYIDEALKEFTHNTQLQHIKKLITIKFRNYQNRYPYAKAKLKTELALRRKGYSMDVINKAMQSSNLKKDPQKEKRLLYQSLRVAKDKYKKYATRSKFIYNMKIQQFLLRKQFNFDEINSVINKK